MTDPSAPAGTRARGRAGRRHAGAVEYSASLLSVVPVTAACWWSRDLLSTADRSLLFILGVLLVASRVSRGPSLVNVLASVASFDFFFVEPRFTLNVADHAFLVTFAVMLVVGFTVSTMTVRIREQADEARERERQAGALASERERLAEEGAAARVAAETERTRNDLLSAVSHDLRTPLATITGAAGELLDAGDGIPPAERTELLETVRQEGERLERLVNGLLELTRIESGTFRPAEDWCAVEELVGSALGRLERPLAGREVAVRLPEEILLVPGDAVLLEQVLVNLLDNARKFAPPGCAIELEARAREGAVEIEVRDRGPGLAPGEEARVFDRYFRGSAHAGTQGWGLGLAVCRAIVQVHGGTVAASNRAGGGSVFRIVLPVAGEPPAGPPPEDPAP